MTTDEVREISLVDIMRAFYRQRRIFTVVLFLGLVLASVFCFVRASKVSISQRVQSAVYVANFQQQPLDQVTPLLGVWFPHFVGQRSLSLQPHSLVSNLRALPVVIDRPIDVRGKDGSFLNRYVPNKSIFDLTLDVKNKSDAAVSQAKLAFASALDSLQRYQAPLIDIKQRSWKQQLSRYTQSVTELQHLNQQLQQSWKQSDLLTQGAGSIKKASSHLVTSMGSVDVASLMAVDRMSNFGLSYEGKLAQLRASIEAADLSSKTLQPSRLVGQPYFISSTFNFKHFLLGGLLSLLFACVVVGLAELVEKSEGRA